MQFRLSVALATVALATAAAGCGSDPFCGDGKANLDLGEQCDDGNDDETDNCLSNCMARPVPQLTIKWEFNQDLDRGFQGDSCFDIGARMVSVQLVGAGVDQLVEEDCSFAKRAIATSPPGPTLRRSRSSTSTAPVFSPALTART